MLFCKKKRKNFRMQGVCCCGQAVESVACTAGERNRHKRKGSIWLLGFRRDSGLKENYEGSGADSVHFKADKFGQRRAVGPGTVGSGVLGF